MTEMAKGDWWFKFEIPAWRNSPELRACSLEARGFWIDCIAIMRDTGKATISGTYKDFARTIGCFLDEAHRCIDELKRNKTADVTLRNEIVTLKSRKYARELKAKELSNLRVKKHREKHNVTPEKRLSEKSNKKEVKKGEELEATASPPEPDCKPVDPRTSHPAIVVVREIVGMFPPKEIWDDIIDRLGFEVDIGLLKKCFTAWRARGYNKMNFAGWIDWYHEGIPKPVRTNGTNRQNNTNDQPSKATSVSRLAETANIINQYPTEAELRDRKRAG